MIASTNHQQIETLKTMQSDKLMTTQSRHLKVMVNRNSNQEENDYN
jgi:hypothetical protein